MLAAIGFLFFSLAVINAEVCTRRCYPGNDCFPKPQDVEIFRKTLDGDIVFPYNSSYHYLTLMYNIHYTRFPSMIVYVTSAEDIQRSILFAKNHSLHITIQSSGHDYIGRSTWDGSFMINLSQMKEMRVNINSTRNEAGEITVQTGNNWLKIYEEVQKYNRVVVGGSAHTVTPGGYTQGGGHSPISRFFGLAVDQVLDLQVVTADGSILNCTKERCIKISPDGAVSRTNSDLFWAIRGGGGGTFGVVVEFTFKLHRQPTQLVHASVTYLLSYNGDDSLGRKVFKFYFDFLKTLPKEWGGYLTLSNTEYKFEGNSTAVGVFILFMNHFGEWDLPSRKVVDKWINFHPEWRISATLQNKTSFWEYEKQVNATPWSNIYMLGTFIQKEHLTEDLAEYYLKIMTTPPSASNPTYGCTATHIGGKIFEFNHNSAPIHSGFRSGILCSSCYVVFEDSTRNDFIIEKGKEFYSGLKKYGHGVYINEPIYHLPDWKDQFWGEHYPKLLEIKKKWDPDNIFTCHNCVGSDIPWKEKATQNASALSLAVSLAMKSNQVIMMSGIIIVLLCLL